MGYLIIFILFWIVFFFGAVTHESDMARNYAKTGDAKAWFFDIRETSREE